MQATILKPLPCPLVGGFNRPLWTRLPDRFNSAPVVSFPLKTTFTRVKSRAKIDTGKIIHPLQYSSPRRRLEPPKALRDIAPSLNSRPNPQNTEKPEWWLRTLASLPYLMNFYDHRSWVYAYPTKNPHPFLKFFDSQTLSLVMAISVLPHFLLSFYTILCYFGVVRQKRWPHFFRFHVMTATLIGTALQIIGATSGWFPSWVFPPHFWAAACVGFFMTEMYCVICVLRGAYAEVPGVSEAAYLYTDLKLR